MRWVGVTAVLVIMPHLATGASLTQKQIDTMTPEQAGATPVLDLMAYVDPNAAPADIRTVLELWLRTLGYYQGWPDGADSPAYHQAVKDFQTATGESATGIVTFKEAGELDRRAERFEPSAGLGLRGRDIYADKNGISAWGTWLDRGKPLPDALNYTHIECRPRSGCSENGFAANVSIDGSYYYVTPVTRTWTIADWTPQRVVANTTMGPCMDMTLTVDAKAQTATLAKRIAAHPLPSCGKPSEYLRDYDLTDGEQVSKDVKVDRDKAREESLNPAYRAVLDRLRKGGVWSFMRSFAVLTEPP
ncbi:MAG: peptidoglycan-binding protein [Alphaproteobacteria bacterium]|nr:peptidoglycan-binding protein [Alphaproteobacteria bacterium]MDE2629605.1 peptidoglycan-binding protein [Alphaproteobacteria bacterium]